MQYVLYNIKSAISFKYLVRVTCVYAGPNLIHVRQITRVRTRKFVLIFKNILIGPDINPFPRHFILQIFQQVNRIASLEGPIQIRLIISFSYSDFKLILYF